MIILDVEMSGLNPDKHSIVSIGAVDFNNPQNRFYSECKIWDGADISEEALIVNGFTKAELLDDKKQNARQILEAFIVWALKCSDVIFVGQNPGKDLLFLENTAQRFNISWPFSHRSLDIHTICVTHIMNKGLELPIVNKKSSVSSDFIMEYVGIPTEPKPHIAINGAVYEAEAFSRILYGKGLLPEFAEFPIPFNL